MARRRRKGNPLLTKILVASLVVHAIALPIAAHYGALKGIERQFGTSRVVMVTLPPVTAEKPKAAKKAEPKPKSTPTKKAGGAPKATAAQRTSVPQPKVVASAAAGDGSGGGPTVDANGTGKAGALPTGTDKPGGNTPPTPTPQPPTNPTPEPKPAAPEPKPAAPEPKPAPAKTPEPTPTPAPKPKRIVQAEAIESPEPTIPDDLRTEPFEKTLVVEADVDTDGKPTNVKVAESTGTKELDDSGVDAAKRYRFRPATIDDEPVSQHVRFRILFKVE